MTNPYKYNKTDQYLQNVTLIDSMKHFEQHCLCIYYSSSYYIMQYETMKLFCAKCIENAVSNLNCWFCLEIFHNLHLTTLISMKLCIQNTNIIFCNGTGKHILEITNLELPYQWENNIYNFCIERIKIIEEYLIIKAQI